MFQIDVTVTGDPLAQWETQLRRIDSVFRSDRPLLRAMADVLEFEHKDAFDRGYRNPDPAAKWEATDKDWASRMEGKPGTKPLVWKGEAAKSIQARVRGDTVEVRGESYLGKFQFGPFEGSVPIKAGGNVAYPGESVVFYEPITVKQREIFGAYQRDADQAMFELGEQIGGMDFTASGGTSVFR